MKLNLLPFGEFKSNKFGPGHLPGRRVDSPLNSTLGRSASCVESRKLPALVGLILLAIACGSSTSIHPLPLATGASLQSYLDSQNYRETWPLYPDKGRQYSPKVPSPHGALLTTYLNGVAHETIQNKHGVLPEGSIIVKENYMPDGAFVGATVMYKVKGYDPPTNDWFWVKWSAEGAIEKEGKVEGCISCHGAKRDNDFIWTSSLR